MANSLFVLPVFRREQYDSFRREIGTDLADTYDKWQDLFAEEVEEARRKGLSVINIEVDFDEFMAHCRASALKPDAMILLEFAKGKKLRPN
jgi:hypothetical protein